MEQPPPLVLLRRRHSQSNRGLLFKRQIGHQARIAGRIRALCARHRADSKAEPGCVQFDWGESTTEPNTFYMHEEYKNRDAYNAHEKTPHDDRFFAFDTDKDPYVEPQVVSLYQTIL